MPYHCKNRFPSLPTNLNFILVPHHLVTIFMHEFNSLNSLYFWERCIHMAHSDELV